jgi:hypothetical protein
MAIKHRAQTLKLERAAAPALSPAASAARSERLAAAKALRSGGAQHSGTTLARRMAHAARMKALRGGDPTS